MVKYASLAQKHGASSVGELWGKLLGEKTRWVAETSVLALCFGCCIFYSAFIGDIFGALSSSLGLTGLLAKRWAALSAMTLFVLLPLCLLEDLSALQFSSILGVTGVLATVAVHVKRLIDGSYAPGSQLLGGISPRLHPSWPTPRWSLWNVNSGTLTLVNMLGVAFLAHYNSIAYFRELEKPTTAKYSVAVTAGFGSAFAVFVTMMLVGYRLFGSSAQPLILNNFHRSADGLATLARVGTGLAITFAYPLMFAGVKSSLFNLFPSVKDKRAKQSLATSALVAITSVALNCGEEDVSLVLGIVGSLLGCGVAYIIPGVLSLQSAKMRRRGGAQVAASETVFDHALVSLGAVFGILGVWITLADAAKHSHH